MTSDAEPQRKTAIVEIDSVRKGDRLIQMRWIVTNEHKLVYYPGSGETMLFDRANDPHEQRNLADEPAMQAVVMDLLKQLLSELARTEMPQCNFHDRQAAP